MEKWIQVNATFGNWGLRGQGDEDIDPADLPISDDLRKHLATWIARFRDMMMDESLKGLGATAGGREKVWPLIDAWDRDGLEIARALKAELWDWTVYHYDVTTVFEQARGESNREFGALIEIR